QRLHSPNVFFRDLAQRLLCERNNPDTRRQLEELVFNKRNARKTRLHALWTLIGTGTLDPVFHERLLGHDDPAYLAWAVRAAGNMGKVNAAIRRKITMVLCKDRSPEVQLQVAIAARKIDGVTPMPLLLDVLASCGEDKLIPAIVWQNLHPLLEDQADSLLQLAANKPPGDEQPLTRLM